MKLRSYKPTEFDEVMQLLKDTNLYFEACDQRDSVNAKSIEDPESIVVAVIDDKIVGCTFIVTEPWCNIIYHTAVHPEFQNDGIGNALLEYSENLIIERGGIQVAMYVMTENVNVVNGLVRKGYKAIPDVTCMYKELV